MRFLFRCLGSGAEGGGVSSIDIRPAGVSDSNLSKAQPDDDLHLCVWGGNRQHGARETDVGRGNGRTEDTLLEMPFKAVYLFRPFYIQPLYGARTKTAWYGAFYAVVRPFYPLLKTLYRTT